MIKKDKTFKEVAELLAVIFTASIMGCVIAAIVMFLGNLILT